MSLKFKKLLVANRGEIAVRIIRACRELGISPVAVYSEADRAALHVRLADEAYPIGPAPSTESYLSIDAILGAARSAGAEAIHPGYGFLSENPRFAEACAGAGLVFVGPPPEAMRLMGSKTAARAAAMARGVPIVPGTPEALGNASDALEAARRIGFPVMLKAAAGGGGKGMRLVHEERRLASDFEAACSEALRAFGDGSVYVEKFMARPRHVEIQVLADAHGNAIHLGERECSVQRRHQKVIEECPSPALDESLRRRMGETALEVVRAAGYRNAGTVEFLLDQEGAFYFLEMNTRLQVEHPVTELVTGLDLVHEQLVIASGEPLSLRQSDVRMRGWALECRVYAEDPDKNFFPSPGRIHRLVEPQGPGIRVDSGVYEGWEVPIHYDPMIAKLIAYGANRSVAIARMKRALAEYRVLGIRTNVGFFMELLSDPDFAGGRLSTALIEEFLARRGQAPGLEPDTVAAAALAAALEHRGTPAAADDHGAGPRLSAWRLAARGAQNGARRGWRG
jgi:acetyl-CoA carboxylase biotin carboxylase subunit